MGRVVLGAEGERGGDQRGERLDVGAHDQDVARLEAGVVLEQAEDDLAEYFDLPGTAVAGVDLDAAVLNVQRGRVLADGVVGEVLLELAEQAVGLMLGGVVDVLGVGGVLAEQQLQLEQVPRAAGCAASSWWFRLRAA